MSQAHHPVFARLSPNVGQSLRIGVVLGQFNADIVESMRQSCYETLLQHGVVPENITVVTVPGALEIPLALQTLARSGRVDGLVALGAVLRGDTYHFEVVANESAAGITRVQLDTAMPMANGILTVDTEDQAWVRVQDKGRDCACVVLEMIQLQKEWA